MELLINKSIQYDIAESFAKKYGIDYQAVVDKYTGKSIIEYKGSVSDFINQLKNKAFTQLTIPSDFSEHIRNRVDIEVFVYTDGAKGVVVIYRVEPNKQ